jgi:hypothetical protein
MQFRALLVAINDYGHPRNNLPSCINDLKYVEQLLHKTVGVPAAKVRTLLDKQVSKEALQKGLQWLTSEAAEDERLLFFFSGHGFQLPGDNGSVEEALVLSGNEFFMDDALVKASQEARPGTLTVLLDCCFGGGADKTFQPTGDFGSFVATKRWSPTDVYLENLSDASAEKGEAIQVASYKPFGAPVLHTKGAPSVIFSESGMTRWPTALDEGGQASINGVLLAACLEDETASASNNQTQGLSAFTYALKLIVGQRGMNLSVQQLRDATDEILKRTGFRQTPTLKIGTGPIDGNSRFLTLDRTTRRPAATIDERSSTMTDKFLDRLAPIIIERVIRELTSKGYAPSANGGADKFLPGGFEPYVPILVDRVIGELTTKGYVPPNGATDKFFPGIEIVAPVLINRVIDELTRKGYAPAGGAAKFFPGADIIAREIIERVVREVSKDYAPNAGASKSSIGLDRDTLRDLVTTTMRELSKKGYRPAETASDKFFPGAEFVIPAVVDRIVREIAG